LADTKAIIFCDAKPLAGRDGEELQAMWRRTSIASRLLSTGGRQASTHGERTEPFEDIDLNSFSKGKSLGYSLRQNKAFVRKGYFSRRLRAIRLSIGRNRIS